MELGYKQAHKNDIFIKQLASLEKQIKRISKLGEGMRLSTKADYSYQLLKMQRQIHALNGTTVYLLNHHYNEVEKITIEVMLEGAGQNLIDNIKIRGRIELTGEVIESPPLTWWMFATIHARDSYQHYTDTSEGVE